MKLSETAKTKLIAIGILLLFALAFSSTLYIMPIDFQYNVVPFEAIPHNGTYSFG